MYLGWGFGGYSGWLEPRTGQFVCWLTFRTRIGGGFGTGGDDRSGRTPASSSCLALLTDPDPFLLTTGEAEEGDPAPSGGFEGAIYTLVEKTIFDVLKKVFVGFDVGVRVA